MMPQRVQRKRTRGWTAPLDKQGRKPIYVGRGSRWGNPNRVVYEPATGGWHVHHDVSGSSVGTFAFEQDARRFAVEAYHVHLKAHPELVAAAQRELAGRDLMCWCPLPAPGELDHCHGAVLLEVANSGAGVGS